MSDHAAESGPLLVLSAATLHGPVVFKSLSLTLHRGEVVTILGSRATGKSALFPALLGVHADSPATVGGVAHLGAHDLTQLSPNRRRSLCGVVAGLLPQDAALALDSSVSTLELLTTGPLLRLKMSPWRARRHVRALLTRLELQLAHEELSAPATRLPRELRQQVALAMALACDPQLLVVDEPLAHLSSSAAEWMRATLRRECQRGLGVVWLTPHAQEAQEVGSRVYFLAQGELKAQERLAASPAPSTPPTRGAVVGQLAPDSPPRSAGAPQLHCEHLTEVRWHRPKWPRPAQPFRVVDNVTLSVFAGETLAVIGRSGSGKTSLGQLLVGARAPTYGFVAHRGVPVLELRGAERARYLRDVQWVGDYGPGALNPRLSVREAIAEGLTHGDASERILATVQQLGFPDGLLDSLPDALSSHARRLVLLARALVREPTVLVLDDPLDGLDTRAQEAVVEVLRTLQTRAGLAFVLLSSHPEHVRPLAHRTVVLLQGRIVEEGPSRILDTTPAHPYFQALQESKLNPSGDPLRPGLWRSGCAYASVCPRSDGERCARESPPWMSAPLAPTHRVLCFHPQLEAEAPTPGAPAQRLQSGVASANKD